MYFQFKQANQSMLNGALVIEMLNNYFSESRRKLGRLIKRDTEKKMWEVKNIFPLDLAKYLSYSEVQKLLMFKCLIRASLGK